MDTLAKRVKAARLKIEGMRQEDLAAASGLKQGDISKIENGRIQKTTGVVAMARALRVDAHWLATGEGSPDVTPDIKAWPLKNLSYEQFVSLPAEFHAAVENFAKPHVISSQTPVPVGDVPHKNVSQGKRKGFVYVGKKLREEIHGERDTAAENRAKSASRKSAGDR